MGILFNREPQTEQRQQLRRDSPAAEHLLWLSIKERAINGYKFRRQFGVGRYVLDFYCPELQLCIEIDGPSHDTQDAQEYDQERSDYLRSCGITILRFTNDEVYESTDAIIERIRKAISDPTGRQP